MLNKEKTQELFQKYGVELNKDMVLMKTEMGQFKIGFKDCNRGSYWHDGCGGSYLITDEWDIKGSATLAEMLVSFSEVQHKDNMKHWEKVFGNDKETIKKYSEYTPIDYMLKHPSDPSFNLDIQNYMASLIVSMFGGKK